MQRIAQQEGIALSRDVLEALLAWVEEGAAKEVFCTDRRIIADRGSLFILSRSSGVSEPIFLPSFGKAHSGDWSVCVEPGEGETGGWQALWLNGEAAVCVASPDDYTLSLHLQYAMER